MSDNHLKAVKDKLRPFELDKGIPAFVRKFISLLLCHSFCYLHADVGAKGSVLPVLAPPVIRLIVPW